MGFASLLYRGKEQTTSSQQETKRKEMKCYAEV
ncbi:hypothetical protein Enr17x_49780 [Gimesia fumaroli]|uniref:Uncharacterized protein n=1 Tax=Gimesia fumaroli TaxID=2527976 RepID=A0A518III3_9PLAN|nr:hypothetical protein Enr17x_49780 [Gimesia fumaroli]